MTKKHISLLILIIGILFIGSNLIPLASKEFRDITFSDFRLSIGPFLTCIAMFLIYKREIKKEKSTAKQGKQYH